MWWSDKRPLGAFGHHMRRVTEVTWLVIVLVMWVDDCCHVSDGAWVLVASGVGIGGVRHVTRCSPLEMVQGANL